MKVASFVLVSALSSLAVVGCSGSGSGDSGEPSQQPSAPVAVDPTPALRVGNATTVGGSGRIAMALNGSGEGVSLKGGQISVETRSAGGEWKAAKSAKLEDVSPLVDLVFVSDNSGSQQGFLEAQVDALASTAGLVQSIDPANRLGLVRVSTGASSLLELSSDPAAFDAAVDRLFVANGQTALFDGVRLASEVLSGEGDGAEAPSRSSCFPGAFKVIVAFTDGRENNSSAQLSAVDDDGVNTSLEDLLELQAGADGRRPIVFTVGVGNEIAADELNLIADANGGFFLPIATWDKLVDGLQVVVDFVSKFRPLCVEPEGPCDEARVKTKLPDGRVVERVTPVSKGD